MSILTGYQSTKYQDSYNLVGSVETVESIPFLVRDTPGGFKDGMSIYPFLSRGSIHECKVQSALRSITLSKRLVSSVIITDPLESPPQVYDNSNIKKFRDHYIVDLQSWDLKNCSKNTKKNVKRLFKLLDSGDYRISIDPGVSYCEDFHTLYQSTVSKYSVSGLLNFSKDHLDKQVNTPGSILVSLVDTTTSEYLGSQLYYIQGDCVYWHLSGYSQKCINLAASFIHTYSAILNFKHLGFRYLVLGSGGGNPGLESYKSGFSTHIKPNYIIKTVHDPETYGKIVIPGNSFFPGYRMEL